MNNSRYERLISVMMSLSGNDERFGKDECEVILGDFERYIKADTDDIWIVMSILFDYYYIDSNDIKKAIWHYESTIGNNVPEIPRVKMVEYDSDLLGYNKNWINVLDEGLMIDW